MYSDIVFLEFNGVKNSMNNKNSKLLAMILIFLTFAFSAHGKQWGEDDACDGEAERPCVNELVRLCGNPPENNQECIAAHAERLMKKTIKYRKCIHNVYLRCEKGIKCSARDLKDLCKW